MQSAEVHTSATVSAPSTSTNIALKEARSLSDPAKESSISTATPATIASNPNTWPLAVTRQRLPRAAKISPCYTNVSDESINAKTRKKGPSLNVNVPRPVREPRRNLKDLLVNQGVTLMPATDNMFSGFRDIICGRGCGHKTASRLSNLKYRLLLQYHRDLYDGAIGKNDKRLVCEMILEHIFEQGGRFVQMLTKDGPWETFSYEMCLSKVSQSFRDLRTVGCTKTIPEASTTRPGTPTVKDLEAWQCLRRDIEARISCAPDRLGTRKLSPAKRSSPKNAKKKKKKTTHVQATSNRVHAKPSQVQVPGSEKTLRRVSMDHGDRSAREGGKLGHVASRPNPKRVDDGKTKQQLVSLTPRLGQGEWPRRVSLELGLPRSETNASGGTLSSDPRDLLKNYLSSLSGGVTKDFSLPENLPIAATPKCSNRSPHVDCLSNATGRFLEISPIKPSFRSNNRVSQVTPSTTTSNSPSQSIAAHLAHFEWMATKNEHKDSQQQYNAVRCTIHPADFRLRNDQVTSPSDDSLFWDIDGSFVEISQMWYQYREGTDDSPLNVKGDVNGQKMQDFFFPSSESIGEITDTSSSDSLMMMDDVDVAMDWFCPSASNEQSHQASDPSLSR